VARCQGIKRDGGRCTVAVAAGVNWCFNHDPARAGERRRNASRAGKSAGGREIRDLKRRISEVIEGVLEGSQDRGRAAVAIQGFNALRGVLDLELKAREQQELIERLEALEAQAKLQAQRGDSRWRRA
jgi:hypothetical protein